MLILITKLSYCNNIYIKKNTHTLKSLEIDLDRKIMSDIAIHDEAAFDNLVNQAKDAIEKKRAAS